MNILLTNDDGCDAPGLRAAYDAIRDFGTVRVVAPRDERSACSHTLSLRSPIAVERRVNDEFGTFFAIDGTPADCVRLGVAELFEDAVDVVVAGVNRGANAGVDTFYSGTVAGAREGAILGMRSIALSQAIRRDVETDWNAAASFLETLIPELLSETLPGPGFWNVNLPAPMPDDARDRIRRVPVAIDALPPEFDRVEQGGAGNKHAEYRYGRLPAYWDRPVTEGTDFAVIVAGGVSVSAVPLRGTW